ncbi:hypothetical protein EVAR_60459_1 [Eumeta japonica]|uniref:Uncharacterized protein n=1 Tax=Eumeta variegata TaxID=151549 RepID=A0A4C1Z5H3_EUMVA|nr:hypothetical protein EVAR_60459_1 [Eumeta japonica]
MHTRMHTHMYARTHIHTNISKYTHSYATCTRAREAKAHALARTQPHAHTQTQVQHLKKYIYYLLIKGKSLERSALRIVKISQGLIQRAAPGHSRECTGVRLARSTRVRVGDSLAYSLYTLPPTPCLCPLGPRGNPPSPLPPAAPHAASMALLSHTGFHSNEEHFRPIFDTMLALAQKCAQWRTLCAPATPPRPGPDVALKGFY